METDNNFDNCQYPRCGKEAMVIWLEKAVCQKHWEWVCDVEIEKAYEKLNVSSKIRKENKL